MPNKAFITIYKHFVSKTEKTVRYPSFVIKNQKERGTTMTANDQTFIAQKIRAQYTTKESTELDALRKLDTKVKRPATVLAYGFGCIGALIMGSGMSLVMTDVGSQIGVSENSLPIGVILGTIGMIAMLLTYPIYKKILTKRKKKYRQDVLALSEQIIKETI